MANLYNVGDNVVCQKKGGQTGTKAITPAFDGVVAEVLAGGEQYRVTMAFIPGRAHTHRAHFKGGIVNEVDMTAA
jgi:hypothetical protein